jgi:hypothetical protein
MEDRKSKNPNNFGPQHFDYKPSDARTKKRVAEKY